MSKSKGNVISPDDLVNDYGCDSLRMYELFVGPPELDAEWDDRGIDGVSRFLKRFWNLALDSIEKDIPATKEMEKTRHKMVYDITSRLEAFSLNTVVSGFMEYTNKLIAIDVYKRQSEDRFKPSGQEKSCEDTQDQSCKDRTGNMLPVPGIKRFHLCVPS